MTENKNALLLNLGNFMFVVGSLAAAIAVSFVALDVFGTVAGLLTYSILASIIFFSVFSMIEPERYL